MPKKSPQFILNIVPLTRISLKNNQAFSYLSAKALSAGTLVSIPFFRRNVEGIVINSKKDFVRLGNIELKKINKILEENFLDENQINLAQFISDYYLSPLGIVMKNFIPKQTKSRKKEDKAKKNPKKNINLTAAQKKAVSEITKTNTKYLLMGPNGSGKTEVYIHSILELQKKNKTGQFLILVPERTLTPQALERYGEYFNPQEIVLLSSDISKGKFYSAWQKIKSGEAKVIIGTRMAVFAPFKKIELIVIDEEQDMSYKQWDMNPRYDARKVAEKIAETHKSILIRGSATPSLESYYQAKNKKIKMLELPPLKIYNKSDIRSFTEIVDLKKERWQKNYSCVSRKLKSEIEFALKYKQQVVLFINRQGMSVFSVCDNCKAVLKCPRCDRSLLYDEKGFYRCAHCVYKTSITPKCDKCGEMVFKNIGLGTQKVEREIEKLFPQARLARLDTQVAKKSGEQKRIYSEFLNKEIDILIGTQMITKGWDLPEVALIGIIDTDNMLFFPDFTTEERAFQNIWQVSGRTGRPHSRFPGTIILQTYQPENFLLQMAAEKNLKGFYAKQLAERKALDLPPFGKLVKLTFQDFKEDKVFKNTQELYDQLMKIKGLKVSLPHSPLLPKIRRRFRRQIVIKIKNKNIPSELEKEIKKLDSGWIIDVDPISLI